MPNFFSSIRNAALALCLVIALPAAASAAAYIKYDGVDGEAQTAIDYGELTSSTRVADILFALGQRTGMIANRIQLHYRGQVLANSQMLSQLPRTGTSCQVPPATRRGLQKQREQVSFCYQKIIWTVTRDRSGRFQLVETFEDMPRRRRIGG